MNETYSKLADIELLSTKDIEALKRIQQQVTKAVEPYNKQSLKIKHSLAPTLTQIAKIQEQYKELVRPVVSALNQQEEKLRPIISALNQQEEKLRPIISALNQQEEKLLPFYQTIANTLNDLDIAQNPAILQEPASNLFEQEILNEIPITLNTLENEFKNIPNSREIIEYIKLLEKYFSKGATVVEHLMSYYSFIKLICDILGIPLPPLETQQ